MKQYMRELESESIFWDRLEDMPFVEAVEMLEDRRASLVEENKALETKSMGYMKPGEADQIGFKINSNNLQISLIKTRIKRLNRSWDQQAWRNAVADMFGREVADELAVIIERKRHPKNPQLRSKIAA